MTQEKTIEVLRKQNAKLQEKLDALKGRNTKYTDDSKNKRVDALISELEEIKKQWNDTMKDLKDEKARYTELIKDLRMVKNIFGEI
jgi:DNA repair exonuclease SbcCD ATPase subunit